MNSFYTLHSNLENYLMANPFVNKVTEGDVSEVDNDRNSVYPLVHIIYGQTRHKGVVEEMDITFKVIDIVHELDNYTINRIDVLNNTNEICKYIVALFESKEMYDLDFKLVGEPSREQLKDVETNGLSGWELTLAIQLPFNYNVC